MKKYSLISGIYLFTLILILVFSGCSNEHGDSVQNSSVIDRITPVKIPDTGQTSSYTDIFGEDSDYTIYPPSYTKLDTTGEELSDTAVDWAMVRDNVTGLIWEVKTDDGSIHDKDNTYDWLYARNQYPDELNKQAFGGYTDWRMPYIRELSYLVYPDNKYDGSGIPPAIQALYFPNTAKDGFWTYDINDKLVDHAWYVNFLWGDVFYDLWTEMKHVRAVRGDAEWEHDNYVDNGNGTVSDQYTGLMWQQDTADKRMTWESALSYCEDLTLAGYTDWRLPNRNELQSLVDKQPDANGDINIAKVFPDTFMTYPYWTSTHQAVFPDSVWGVHFAFGNVVSNQQTYNLDYVRAVRTGENVLTTPTPSGNPLLVWVSSRDATGGVDNSIYSAQPDFTSTTLANITRQTSLSWLGLYSNPTMVPEQNLIICAMTQGSMLYTDIRSVDLSTGLPVSLTSTETRNNTLPVVTPDRQIIYSSMIRDDYTWELRQMNLDGTNNTLLATFSRPIESIGISPNGETLALVLVEPDNTTDLYTIDANGKNLTRVTDTPEKYESSVNYQYDGKLIFIAEGVVPGQTDIYQIKADGTALIRLTNGEMEYEGPLWQYGRYIVFGSDCNLWVHDSLNADNSRLTVSEACDFQHHLQLVQ